MFVFIANMVVLSLSATHLTGGEITYRHLNGNNYEVRSTIYRDCSGVAAPTQLLVNISSSCGNFSATLDSINSDTIVYCTSTPNYCNGGTLPGMEWIHYADTIQLSPCSDWLFSYNLCCRNFSNNITNSMNEYYYLETKLDNSQSPNSSPIFNQSLNLVAEVNSPFCINNNAFDLDGDSLAFSLVNPLGAGGSPLNFEPGYTTNQPFGVNSSFNNASGNICLTPNQIGNFVTAVKIDEYRNGNIVGSIIRDIQVSFVSGISVGTQDIQGVVYDDLGNPVSGATVELLEYGISQGTLNLAGTQTTGANGGYIFNGQNVRQYLVRAQPVANYLSTYHESTAYWQHAQVVYSLCDAQVTADVTYVDANNPLGTGVISGYLNGTGIFRSGDPIEGVNILLYDLETETLIQSGTTDANGYFELNDLATGSYYILVDAEGLAMTSTHFFDFTDGEIVENANFFATEDGIHTTGSYDVTGYASIHRANTSNFDLLPNPGSDIVKIRSKNNLEYTVQMYSSNGQKIMEVKVSRDKTFDMSGYESGLYFFNIVNATNQTTLKWIKN